MAKYMADRIIRGVYTYEYVADKRPDLMEEIDLYLISNGYSDLIPKEEVEEEEEDNTPTVLPEDKPTTLPEA